MKLTFVQFCLLLCIIVFDLFAMATPRPDMTRLTLFIRCNAAYAIGMYHIPVWPKAPAPLAVRSMRSTGSQSTRM